MRRQFEAEKNGTGNLHHLISWITTSILHQSFSPDCSITHSPLIPLSASYHLSSMLPLCCKAGQWAQGVFFILRAAILFYSNLCPAKSASLWLDLWPWGHASGQRSRHGGQSYAFPRFNRLWESHLPLSISLIGPSEPNGARASDSQSPWRMNKTWPTPPSPKTHLYHPVLLIMNGRYREEG